jgi:beta-N-acetylhexosaminidase
MREVHGVTGIEAYRPATINRHLNEDLLRGRLGFKGLIVSDATPMAGLGSWLPRDAFVPEVLNAGCDVILFTPDLPHDIGVMESELDSGKVTWDRVDEAILRQLALKAAVGLHRPQSVRQGDRVVEDRFGADLMARVPTLVKDGGVLPLDPARHRRVLLVSKGVILPFVPHPLPLVLPGLLREAGFEVTEHVWGTPVDPKDHDLLIYAFAEESLLTRGSIFINWAEMTGSFGGAMERHWHDIPTIMLSFGHPYYLYDAPMVPTYINAYSAHPAMQAAVVEVLVGKASFSGRSPVDPFCGMDVG